jgi:drug/metabolite transporter (DMT)-like permease
MFNSRAKQIPALICTRPVTTKNLPREKMINIGGRPVLVTNPDQSATGRDRADSIKLALAFAAIYLVWGSTYLAIRYAVETIPPLVTAGIRHAIAGTILFAWAWARGFRPTRANWISSCALGALFFLIGHGSLHWAEQYVGSGLAALLIATEPMFILVLAWSMGQQKISRLSALGLGLGVLGVALLTGAELTVKGSSLLGLMAVLLGSLSWSVGVVISPKLKLPTDALGRTALPTLCGAVMLLAAAGPRVSDRVRFDHRVHRLHLAAAALPAGAGGNAHLCQSSGGRVPGMAARVGTTDPSSGAGVGGNSWSDPADSAG